MKKSTLIGALAAVLVVLPVGAETLNFDDVGVQGNFIDFDQPYRGFNFSDTLDVIDLVNSPWSFGAHSGEFALLNNYGGVGVVIAVDAATSPSMAFGPSGEIRRLKAVVNQRSSARCAG